MIKEAAADRADLDASLLSNKEVTRSDFTTIVGEHMTFEVIAAEKAHLSAKR